MFLLNLLLLLGAPAQAEEAKFTILGKNQCAPFEGVLLNKQATAQVLAGYARMRCPCRLRIR